MYKFFVFLSVIAVVSCAIVPPKAPEVKTTLTHPQETVAILSQESNIDPEGSFKWSFESADGTKAEQTGELKTLDKDTVVENIVGSYSFVDPEGNFHEVHYEANENGFFPISDDIAPENARNLVEIAANPHPIETELST